MRVLYDPQIFSLQVFGGISRYFSELMHAWEGREDMQYRLPVAFSNNRYLTNLKGPVPRRFFPGTFLPGKKTLLKMLNRRGAEAALRAGDYDLFHPTYYDPYFVDALGDRPFVLTVHDMIHELYPEIYSSRHDISQAKKLLVEKAEAIITVSENTKRDLLRFHKVDPGRIHVVHHAGGLPLPGPKDVLPPLPGEFVVFVGNRGHYKNFDRFARAMAGILATRPALHVVCVGGGPFKPADLAGFERGGVAGRFIQLSVSDGVLAQLYARARAFVFPSLYEGFGIPVLEAFEAGCPVALSRASCFPEVAGDAAVYFDPMDEASIAAAVLPLLKDPELRARYAALGRERAKAFTWAAAAERTREAYLRASRA